MTFKLLFSSKAEKQIRKLSGAVKAKIEDACVEIREDPWHKATIKVQSYDNIRRKRVGKYRILYLIDKDGAEIIVDYHFKNQLIHFMVRKLSLFYFSWLFGCIIS